MIISILIGTAQASTALPMVLHNIYKITSWTTTWSIYAGLSLFIFIRTSRIPKSINELIGISQSNHDIIFILRRFLNPRMILFMPKYHIPNQMPENYHLVTIISSKTKHLNRFPRSFLGQMQELWNSKALWHQIYLSATLFFLIHMLRIAFYLGTLMASTTEIIQKTDGLDFSEAEMKSKGQMETFAYNNIGKLFHVNRMAAG